MAFLDFMDNTERIGLFRSAASVEALQPVFQELLTDKGAVSSFVAGVLGDFVEHPEKLSGAEGRRLLSCVFLLAGMAPCMEAYGAIFRILRSVEFGAKVSREEWLSSEISRLLGVLSPADAVPEILDALLDPGIGQVVSEQLLLTLSCRWVSRRDNDASFLETVRKILSRLPEGKVDFEIAMALVINAVAVGGDQLREPLFAFYRAHKELLEERLTEKNLQSFFDLGRQRIKAMLMGNYLGGYGPLPSELDRLVNYADIALKEEEPTTLKALPPIVRDQPKIGRNDPCPCGSGKKYKKCCGR